MTRIPPEQIAADRKSSRNAVHGGDLTGAYCDKDCPVCWTQDRGPVYIDAIEAAYAEIDRLAPLADECLRRRKMEEL